jgi:two-component system, LytTR family, response regulator
MTPKTLTCVLVDDEQSNLDVLANYASQVPSLILKATFVKPIEALNYLLQNPTDLLITDINMPQLSGIDLYSAIRTETDTQVIFVSGYSEKILEAMKYSATDYIQKPITLWRFEYAIQKVLASANYERKEYENIPSEYLKRAWRNVTLLSKQELNIIDLVLKGHSSSKISEILFVLPKTIENHRTHIRKKLGILPEHSLRDIAEYLYENERI